MPNYSGMWNLVQQLQAVAAGNWPLPPFSSYNPAPSTINTFTANSTFAAGISNCQSLVLSFDGTKAFAADFGSTTVSQYALATPYEISTASFTKSYTPGTTYYTYNSGTFFSTDGTKMFVIAIGGTAGIHQYSVATAFDVGSVTYQTSIARADANAGCMSYDGLNLYITDANSTCFWYTMTTPFDISTATLQSSTSLGSSSNGFQVTSISTDGSWLVLVEGISSNGVIRLLSLSTPFNPATASVSQTLSPGLPGFMCWAFFNQAQTRMYLATTGTSIGANSFRQYNR